MFRIIVIHVFPSFSVIRGNFGPFHFEPSTICCTWMNNKRRLTLSLTIYGVRGNFENFNENFVKNEFLLYVISESKNAYVILAETQSKL